MLAEAGLGGGPRAVAGSLLAEALGGGRGRAHFACSYRQAGASVRLLSANSCSLLQLCCSKVAWTLNCQVSRSQEAREHGPEEIPDPAPPFPYPARVEKIPVCRSTVS